MDTESNSKNLEPNPEPEPEPKMERALSSAVIKSSVDLQRDTRKSSEDVLQKSFSKSVTFHTAVKKEDLVSQLKVTIPTKSNPKDGDSRPSYGSQMKELALNLSEASRSSRRVTVPPNAASSVSPLPSKGNVSTTSLVGSAHSFFSYTSDLLDDLTEQQEIEDQDQSVGNLVSSAADHGFDKLRQVYSQVNSFLSQVETEGVTVDPIRDEFANLWAGIRTSHENETCLIRSDRKLSAKLASAMGNARLLIKLAEDNPELAARLGGKLMKAWNTVEIKEEQEMANQAKIDQLRQEILELHRSINNASRVEGQDQLQELQNIKNELEKERDSTAAEAGKQRFKLNALYAKRQESFERRSMLEERREMLEEEILAQDKTTVLLTARKERLVAEIEETLSKTATKQSEEVELEHNLVAAAANIIETGKAIHDQRLVNEVALRDADSSISRIDQLKFDVEYQQRSVERMTMDAYRRSQELKIKEEEVTNLKTELQRGARQRTLHGKKLAILQQALASLEVERESLKAKITVLERDLVTAQKVLEENKLQVEELGKERSFINRNLKRANAVTSEHTNQAQTHEVAVRNLEHAVKLYAVEIGDQKYTIIRLEKDRDFYSHEATKLAQQVAFKLNDIKSEDIAIFEYRKRLGVLQTQLKRIEQVFEVAIYDKAMFEKNLRDTLTEIIENVAKIRRFNNQVAALKLQVNEKDEVIYREAMRYDRILKETEYLSTQSKRIQRMAEDSQRQGEALEGERSILGCFIAEINGELSKESFYAGAAASRAAVYQRKLMAKESELRDVWDKWRALHSTIRIGAYHYRHAMRAVRQLRQDILHHKKRHATQLQSSGNYARLRHEAAVLEEETAREKCMINALTQQLKHPINIHRWRLLEATDPEAYELVQKINLLTKRLVDRNFTLKSQTKELEEKQEMYVEIRHSVERSRGLETSEEMVYYQGLLSSKKKQLARLKTELTAAEAQTQFYRESVQRLSDQMMELKKKYFKYLEVCVCCCNCCCATGGSIQMACSRGKVRTAAPSADCPGITTVE